AYFLHAGEIRGLSQEGGVIGRQHAVYEVSGLGRQRKIVPARPRRREAIKPLGVHCGVRGMEGRRELPQQIFGLAIPDITIAFGFDDFHPSHPLSSGSSGVPHTVCQDRPFREASTAPYGLSPRTITAFARSRQLLLCYNSGVTGPTVTPLPP